MMGPRLLTAILVAMLLTITLIGFSSCGNPMALMMSGGGLVISQNSYSKLYNGLDAIVVITTDKNIKTKVIEKVKKLNIK